MFTVHAISDQVSVLVDQAELTPKSSTGNIYLSAQNIGNEKTFRTHSPPAYQSSSNGSSRRGSIQGKIGELFSMFCNFNHHIFLHSDKVMTKAN